MTRAVEATPFMSHIPQASGSHACASECPGVLIQTRGLSPIHGVSNSGGLGCAQESAFLTLPKLMNSVDREKTC